MTEHFLERMTWPEVEAAQTAGVDAVLIPIGSTEQHGRHMPLATDALIGDHLARELADRLDAFVAPTVRIGCSSHHLAFPGTLSVADATFHAIVADLVGSLVGGGFRRLILVPTHGGNFAPLAEAIERLPAEHRVHVVAITDLAVLFHIAELGRDEFGVPMEAGGLHAGEWETSMLAAIHPDLVRMDRAEPGYVGDLESAVAGMFEGGVKSISENGAIGDPAAASPEHGRRYWDAAIGRAVEEIEGQSAG